MVTAIFSIKSPNSAKIIDGVEEFNTIKEMEDFLAYNRAYIKKITFEGTIKIDG